MNKLQENSFKKIYFIFFSIFILLFLSFTVFIMYFSSQSSKELIISMFIFFTVTLTLIMSFIFTMKLKIREVFNSLDNIIENAINGKDIMTDYDETRLSSLENRIFKFINISKSNWKSIEEERSKVESLISDISHQTKTPISNILIYSELLLEKTSIEESNIKLVKDISTQSEKLSWLIQSLVKMSRLETGLINVNIKEVPIVETIKKSIKAVFNEAENKKIQIEVCCNEKIYAYHDSKWTNEALINIMENAIKYTEESGKVGISVIPYEMFTRIDIWDTGIGIDESEINNIFKRFYRSSRVSEYNGVGIGLYLARKIIESQKGYIKVKSQINKGSVFSVFLPNNK